MEIENRTAVVYKSTRKVNKEKFIRIGFLLLPIITFIVSITIGRYSITIQELITLVFSKLKGIDSNLSSNIETIFFNVRLPRIISAMLIGGALSASGASYQGVFRNPMVSPDILGASAGAGFGAGLGILLSFNVVGIQITSFIFGLGAVTLAYLISSIIERKSNTILTLILSGMVISTLFQSLLSLIKYVADPTSKLPAITFWLMGSLSSINMSDLILLIIPIILGLLPLILLRWKLNVLSFGEDEAKSMGVDTIKIRFIVIFASTIMTSAVVSISGMIGWIGLVIPHLSRLIAGPDYKKLIPVSISLGSSFLLIVDNISRSLFSMELPIGILTSMIGAPFFIYLLFNGRKGWL
ncbi:FecCD family ABC transporter permease [Clostridium saccharoperbutylacetonicum]|uniref:FecCD family ABC transporter permease n=1 Tax=Clostridium saccharoperbutylacetonicum TaxID=36745 RepID=UPI000983B933|nr:iron ABC transporter permease [Clostridium saccharoperbutylacetonicum]AQR95490.1 putative ABC transporter permease protein [Clostridium saccharoperbutylacetonicum]NSB31349.1 iron complex transport system permease protein [Clostridium saccharoperbutylacetonicum]